MIVTEVITDDWSYIGGYVVWRCDGCYRDCSVISRYSSGIPEKCPYGLNNHDYKGVEE